MTINYGSVEEEGDISVPVTLPLLEQLARRSILLPPTPFMMPKTASSALYNIIFDIFQERKKRQFLETVPRAGAYFLDARPLVEEAGCQEKKDKCRSRGGGRVHFNVTQVRGAVASVVCHMKTR